MGVFEKYVDGRVHHMWVEPKKMDDPEIVAKPWHRPALDAAKLLARSQDADVKAKLIENTQSAVERGCVRLTDLLSSARKYSSARSSLREVEEMVSGK